MAAVQQRTPAQVDPKGRTAFIESMEEEVRRVSEHLEMRHRGVRTPRKNKSRELVNGYSFSEGCGSEAGARRRRINKFPRQLSVPPDDSTSPPSPVKSPNMKIPFSAPADLSPPTNEPDGERSKEKRSSFSEPPTPSATSAPVQMTTPISPPPRPVEERATMVVQTAAVEMTPLQDPETPIPEPPERGQPQESPPPGPQERSTTTEEVNSPEVKSLPVKAAPTKHSRSIVHDQGSHSSKDESRHAVLTHSKSDNRIHITVASSVDKSQLGRHSTRQPHSYNELASRMRELQAQMREKEDELGRQRRRHEEELRKREEQLKKLLKDNNRLEREKWELLKRARDAAERSLHLRTQLDIKEGTLRGTKVELNRARDELMSVKSANTSLRALLSDLRRPKSSVDVGVQVDYGGTLRRNRSIELAMTQGLSGDHDSGFERSTEFRMSSSTLGESWSERWDREVSIASSLFDEESRETTPVPTPQPGNGTPSSLNRSKRKKGALFGRIRKSSGKRGSTTSVEGLDMSQSSIIQGPRQTPISFPYFSISPDIQEHWRVLSDYQAVPFAQWNVRAIVAWMETGIGMSQYTAVVREKVTSGHALMALGDLDMEKKLGITNPLHRRKLRLAIEDYRVPAACLFPHAGKIDHSWVACEWATDIGLPHLSETLLANMVDGRVLNSLTKEDIRKLLKITRKSEQLSFLSGVELLRMHEFNREAILDHHRTSRNALYWTNRDVCDWLKDIQMEEYANHVLGSGVHGALLFLERSNFTSEHLANILHIPSSKTTLRRHLSSKLALLFSEDLTTESHEAQGSSPPDVSVYPMTDCPHPIRKNTLTRQCKTPSPPSFQRTNSGPIFSQLQHLRMQDRARLSLRDSALRSVGPPPQANRSATPLVLSGTTV